MEIEQIVFVLILLGTLFFSLKLYGKILSNIRLGKSISFDKHDKAQRWKNVLLIAFGQKKMFKKPIPALLHLFIYIAFLITQIELIEIIIDGVTGSHRIFAHFLGRFYTFILNFIEILSSLALFSSIIFIVRRVFLKVKRFHNDEMVGWPRKDALIILFGEILLVSGIFMMNGTDAILQTMNPEHYPATGHLYVSHSFIAPLFSDLNASTLHMLERLGWWLHVLVVFGFILYLPISKHLHIFLAFFNVYQARLSPKGKLENMPDVEKEVKSMLGIIEETNTSHDLSEIPEFGAKDIFDLTQRDILAAYTCTECGRCTAQCPANYTGKKLSPRKIMMDVRDRTNEVGRTITKKAISNIDEYNDTKNLFSYISKEEIHACTSCNACVEACPVMINPLDIIIQLRRYEILTEAAGPSEWIPMFTSLENSGAVWQVQQERDTWTKQFND